MNLVKQTVIWSAKAGVVALLVPLFFQAWKFSLGSAVGIFLADFELVSFLLLSYLLSPYKPSPAIYGLTSLFVLAKVPVLVIAVYLGVKLDTTGLAGFLFGLGLVYFVLVLVAFRTAKHE